MSFGYSIGDIVLVCQCASKLYNKLKNSGSEYAELSDRVHVLHCSLEYLSQHEAEIFSDRLDNKAAKKMQQTFVAQVKSCDRTLNNLQKILDKYKEHFLGTTTTNVPQPQCRLGSLRTVLARNLKKLEWAGKGNELNNYLEKLKIHREAIDSILGIATCIKAEQTHETTQVISRQISATLDPNTGQLAKEIHRSVSEAQSRSTGVIFEVKDEQNECLKTLFFPELDRRQNDVLEAQEGTFGWIWENKRFCDWDAQEHGIFWISGKAGSGKSTVMKRILERFMARNTTNEIKITAGFFFNARGADIEKTREGLLRTLLVHILQQTPSLFHHVLPEYRRQKDCNPGAVIWHCNVLQKLLLQILADPSIHSTVLVIDALDECLDNTISRLLEPTSAIQNLRTCISSRPCTTLLRNLYHSPHRLILEVENREAISFYVRRRMKSIRQWNQTIDQETEDLVKQIIKTADGVFLWVELVVEELVLGVDNGDTIMELRDKLSKIPPDLDGLYHRMLSKINESIRKETINMLYWVLFATRPLTAIEFRYAHSAGRPQEFLSQKEMCNSDVVVRDDDQMERRLIDKCGGFLEIKEQQNQKIVQLIHQSAREFLLNYAPRDPAISTFVVEISTAHLEIAQTCIKYLSFDEFNRKLLNASSRYECGRDLALLYREHPLLEYAAGNWPKHVSRAHLDQEKESPH